MRETKCRATRLADGETIYGYYLPFTPIIPEFEKVPCIIDDEGYFYAIDKCTLQQLCGYDDNGDEIYEGDVVCDDCGEYTISLNDMTVVDVNGHVEHAPAYMFIKKKGVKK